MFILLESINPFLKFNPKKTGLNQGCPTFWRLWATLEEQLSWATH